MRNIKWYRTWENGKVETHIDGIGDAYTLCGKDTAGDEETHDRYPIQLTGDNHRLTCKDCQAVVKIVKEFLRKK